MDAIDLYAAFAARTPTKTIWVSPQGNNANKGDAGSPLKTIQAAVDKAAPGTAIMVKAGTYKGSVDLGGLHGTPDKPIKLISADGQGAAKIVGSTGKAAIQAYKISNVGIHDFEVVSNTTSGDIGGMKIWGPWDSPARNIVISGNIVTGKGTDGIKLFNGAKDVLVIGNTIKGNWRQEAIDNVSVEDTVFAYNTIKGTAKNSGITMTAGSRNIELFGNDIDLTAAVGIYVGGHGNSRLNRSFPDYWEGFEAKNIHVHDNVIGKNITGRSLAFVGANNSTVEKNSFADNVGSVAHKVSSHFTYHSFNNKLIDNSVANGGFFKPNSGESKGYVVSGNAVGGSKPSAGVDSPKLAGYLVSRGVVDTTPPSGDGDGTTVPDFAPPPSATPAFRDASSWQLGSETARKIVGTTGNDKMTGSKGDEIYVIGQTGDRIVEQSGHGTDTAFLWIRNFTLSEHVENLIVRASKDVNATGNGLDNVIVGNTGADVITGLGGADLLTGGAGRDTFVYTKLADAGDVITDFKRGTDTLDLRPLTAGLTGESIVFSRLEDGLAVMVERNGTEHGLALLQGVSDNQLTIGTDILV
ncbi:MAG TPA: right-handed parallel beta-helix repeat-containing protein [Arenibaculum sp.]|nr:right-handed parallel beta-helix repeat-containing protein [Arenibaculum sp.]